MTKQKTPLEHRVIAAIVVATTAITGMSMIIHKAKPLAADIAHLFSAEENVMITPAKHTAANEMKEQWNTPDDGQSAKDFLLQQRSERTERREQLENVYLNP